MGFANAWGLKMGDYFVKRDSRTGYFVDSGTSSPKQTREVLPSPSQTTGSSSKSPYSNSSARVVTKKYALKRD